MTATLAGRIPPDIGDQLLGLVRTLLPFNRSITGQGVRDTLAAIGDVAPLEVHAIPTGTQVFDWTIPKEWNLKEAYIEDSRGNRIVDSRNSNLHVVGYSVPIDARMPLAELKRHLHTLPDQPDWIPYRTSYYKETWGFCLSHRQLEGLTDGEYHVRIDASLEPGVLNYGEAVIPGRSTDEFLLSAHVCHPTLCNDNLSGIAIAAWIARLLAQQRRRYTYRVLFIPGTIGAIAWLATHRETLGRVKHGLVLALLGRSAPLTYKKTRNGTAEIDAVAAHVLRRRGGSHEILEFSPWGYDERQFNSPGIALDVGRLSRGSEGGYPEYHTSADDFDLLNAAALGESFAALCEIIDVVERNGRYRNLRGYGEPQLGKYGLYENLGGASSVTAARLALLWVLNQSDGSHSLLDIAERSGLLFDDIVFAAERLHAAGLLEPLDSHLHEEA